MQRGIPPPESDVEETGAGVTTAPPQAIIPGIKNSEKNQWLDVCHVQKNKLVLRDCKRTSGSPVDTESDISLIYTALAISSRGADVFTDD